MKMHAKRLTAILLVLCLLLSAVPMVFAEESTESTGGGEETAGSVIYDFDLAHSSLRFINASGNESGFSGKTLYNGTNAVAEYIKSFYNKGELNWYFNYEHTISNDSANSAKFHAAANGLRVYSAAGEWIAFRLKSPGAGAFEMSMAVPYTEARGASEVGVYILSGDATATEIGQAVSSAENALGTVSMETASETGVAELNSYTFEADKEYVVAFKVEADSDNSDFMYLAQLIAKPTKSTVTYDFNLAQSPLRRPSNDGSFSGKTLYNNGGVVDDIKSLYKSGDLNWYFNKEYTISNTSDNNAKFRNQESSLRVYSAVGEWIAFRFISPGAGEFEMSMTVPYVGSGAAAAVGVYIIPGDEVIGQVVSNPENSLGTVNMETASETGAVELSSYTFEAGKEYIVAFKVETDSESGENMYLGQLLMTGYAGGAGTGGSEDSDDEPTPPEEIKIPALVAGVYDFDLERYKDKTIAEATEEIGGYYSTDVLNWSYAGSVNTESAYLTNPDAAISFTDKGLQVKATQGSWAAFKIKSPGEGAYTLSLTHAVSTNGANASNVYILPADTADISAAIKDAKAAGTVSFYSGEASGIESGYRTMIGSWKFTAGAEYIVVLEATESCGETTNAYMIFSRLLTTEGADEFYETENLGSFIRDLGMRVHIASYEVNGQDYYFLPIKGGKMLVYNLETMEKIDELNTGINNPWAITVDSDGTVFVGGDAKYIYQYDPYAREGKQLGYITSSSITVRDIVADENDVLYFCENNKLHSYDQKTGKYTVLCASLHADGKDALSIAYSNGYVYVNIYGDTNKDGVFTKAIVKYDIKTQQVVGCADISAPMGSTNYVYDIHVVGGDVLIAGTSGLANMVAVDINTMELIDIGIAGGCYGGVSEERDGKVYFVAKDAGLCAYDIATRKATQVPGFADAGVSFRCEVNSFVTVPSLSPNELLFTCSTGSKGGPIFYDLKTGETYRVSDLTAGEGAEYTTRSIINGLPGTNEILIGGYTTSNCVVYNIETGKVTYKYTNAGQTDTQVWYNGVLYAGCYSAGVVVEVDPYNNTKKTLVDLAVTDGQADFVKQARIHGLTAGDGKIFFSSVPTTGQLGGTVGWYDVETGETFLDWNAVDKQMVISLVYHDGYLYGATSTYGGTGSTRTEKTAVIVVYDVANKTKVGEYEIAIDGIVEPDYISGVAVDGDGQLWGLVSETLFSFNFDKETKTMTFTEELSFSKTDYAIGGSRYWFSRPILFGEDGYIYLTFGDNGGMRRVNPEDPKGDNARLMSDAPLKYVLAEDGNLYYLSGKNLNVLYLGIAPSDESIAAEVQTLINAIGTVTLESEAAIQTARTAYDALTDAQKALVDAAKLTAAEAKLAELKAAAEKEAADKAAVDAVTAKIEAIGTVTLESEEAIKAARAAYNALTAEQKALVTNLNVLTAAEAALEALQKAEEPKPVEPPKTGDTAPTAVLAAVLMISAAAMTALAVFEIRRKQA